MQTKGFIDAYKQAIIIVNSVYGAFRFHLCIYCCDAIYKANNARIFFAFSSLYLCSIVHQCETQSVKSLAASNNRRRLKNKNQNAQL